jgi:hypothetical protein
MRRRRASPWGIFPLAGWLFTDLLLALAVIFLVVSASGTPPKPTPTPPLPCLELHPAFLPFTVDYQGLLNNNATAIKAVQRLFRTYAPIQGRRAGLVIIYDGTGPQPYQIDTANQVGTKIDNALAQLGKSGFVFVGTVYHDPLLLLGSDLSAAQIEIYLFALPGHCSL